MKQPSTDLIRNKFHSTPNGNIKCWTLLYHKSVFHSNIELKSKQKENKRINKKETKITMKQATNKVGLPGKQDWK